MHNFFYAKPNILRIFAIVKIDESIALFANYVGAERRLAEGTLGYYIGEVERFAQYLSAQGIDTLDEISANDIRTWLMSKIEQGTAASTVNKQTAALRAWMKYLRRQGHMEADLMAKITPPKQPKKLPIFFRENEVEHIYDTIYPEGFDGETHKLVLRMLYETGMRRSELSMLPLSNIDLGALTIKVRGKRNKERIIPIEKELAHNISKYIALRNKLLEELMAENPALADESRLLVNSKGHPVSDATIYSIVRRYMGTMSYAERTSPHVFRHSFATHMLNEGANIDAIKELLGHTGLAATEVYTHVTREHLKETYKHAHPRAIKNKEVKNEHNN